MKFISCITFIICLITASCKAPSIGDLYESDTLQIKQLTENTYIHISYLQTNSFGKVACNGMIVTDNGEALIVDTPANNTESKELIEWVETNLKTTVIGVVATHFHVDCLGGLQAFHDRNIPSYSNNHTIQLAQQQNRILPLNGFDNYVEIPVGNQILRNEFVGEGHTKDNIVSYFPSEKVLFGGCLVKSVGAGKGNLEDATIGDWAITVEKVKSKYNDVTYVIPGHGGVGGQELLDFTMELFQEASSKDQ